MVLVLPGVSTRHNSGQGEKMLSLPVSLLKMLGNLIPQSPLDFFWFLISLYCSFVWRWFRPNTHNEKHVGKSTIINVVVHAQIGKEFPNMKQNERRIEFIRVGDEEGVASTMGQLPESQGELTLFLVCFYSQGTRNRVGVLWVICWLNEVCIHSLYRPRRRVKQIPFLTWGKRGTGHATQEGSKIPQQLQHGGKGDKGLVFSVPTFQHLSCSSCSFVLRAPQ